MDNEQAAVSAGQSWGWVGAAVLAQLGWGTSPVLMRYLQTISGLPGFSMLVAAHGTLLLLIAVLFLPRMDKSIFRHKFVWLFALLVAARGISNMLAVQYTLAVYVQIIYLMTPFVVALISRLLLREKLPDHTFKAMFAAFAGALLIAGQGLGETAVAASRNDFIGVPIAITSTVILALYMVAARHASKYNLSASSLWIVQTISLFVFSTAAALLTGETLSAWRGMQFPDWGILLLLTFGVLLGANMGQIGAIQRLGAPLVSSTMALRLVSSLIFAALLLGERLTTGFQLAGAVVIMITITLYLRQNQGNRPRSSTSQRS